MEDSYSLPFKRAIQVGGAAGVMYACNMVNHVPAVASADLAGRLRSWGFTGYRTTDGDGIGGISAPNRQNYTRTTAEAIRIAMTDGESDIDDGGTCVFLLFLSLAYCPLGEAEVNIRLQTNLHVFWTHKLCLMRSSCVSCRACRILLYHVDEKRDEKSTASDSHARPVTHNLTPL